MGSRDSLDTQFSQLPLQLGCRHVTWALENRYTQNPPLNGEPGSKNMHWRVPLWWRQILLCPGSRSIIQCPVVQAVMSVPIIALVSIGTTIFFPWRSFSWITASHHHICRPCCHLHPMSVINSLKYLSILSPPMCLHRYISLGSH